MTNPFPNPPGTNPPRHVHEQPANLWAVAALAVGLAVLFACVVELANIAGNPSAASNPAPTTTGQTVR